MRYKTLEELIDMISGSIKTNIFNIYQSHKELFLQNKGSQHNHQEWQGGYIDHITETMNIARLLHQSMTSKRSLSFSLSDVLIVLFLHDIEKIYPDRIQTYVDMGMSRPKAKDKVRYQMMHQTETHAVWYQLTDAHKNALDHVEGENDSYVNNRRTMSPLAAFCHICDVASARIWYDRPNEIQEPWGFRQSIPEEEHNMWGV